MIDPIFPCFLDADPRVRYFACEALYNILKICRVHALQKFEQLFDILWKLSSDTEQYVRSGSELSDRLLKEIVVSSKDFNAEEMMVLLRDRIYSTNSSNRRFIISWLNAIITIPRFSITQYIPELIDGVFKTLEDPLPVVREATLTVLKEMVHKLEPNQEHECDISSILNVLVVQTNSNVPICRETAIGWLNQICIYYQEKMLPHLSLFLMAILPSLTEISLKANEVNQRIIGLVKEDSTSLDIDSIVEVLLAHLRNEKSECRVVTLNWIRHLYSKQQSNLLSYMERLFPVLLELLSDSSDEVLILDITLITEVCVITEEKKSVKSDQIFTIKSLDLSDELRSELKSLSPYLILFTVSLLKMFKDDLKLMDDRGIQIIRQICLLLNPADVYYSLSMILNSICVDFASNDTSTKKQKSADDFEFVSKMVILLNRILMTTCELFNLRQFIRAPEQNNCVELFQSLYKCWCHHPICLLSLYLLSQNYTHALELVQRFCEIDITVEILVEMDRLVQLIESPILAYVRMDLLNADHQRSLGAILSAILMLLPQTDAFNTLQKRLQLIPNLMPLESTKKSATRNISTPSTSTGKIKFKELIQYYDKIQEKKTKFTREKQRKLLEEIAEV